MQQGAGEKNRPLPPTGYGQREGWASAPVADIGTTLFLGLLLDGFYFFKFFLQEQSSMGDAGRKFPFEQLERHCGCAICRSIQFDRAQRAANTLSEGPSASAVSAPQEPFLASELQSTL